MWSKKIVVISPSISRVWAPRGSLKLYSGPLLSQIGLKRSALRLVSQQTVASRCATGPSVLPRSVECDLDAASPKAAKQDVVYNKEADALLEEMAAWVESLDWPEIENVDCQDGVLVIDLAADSNPNEPLTRTIVINKHYVNRQLWYSCPISGGDYFPFKNGWKSLRSHVHIREKLEEDLKILTGRR